MKSRLREKQQPVEEPRPLSKKDQILALYTGGITEVGDLALIIQARPSYVAGVLRDAGIETGYFDLYTSSSHAMNVYSKFFAGRLGFKDEGTARSSVALLDRYYRQFELAGDRAGQHHTLLLALTLFNRARWTNKEREAEPFGRWLSQRLDDPTGRGPAPARRPRELARAR